MPYKSKKSRWSDSVATDNSGMIQAGHVSVSAGQDEGIFQQHSAEAGVSYLQMDTGGRGMETANMDIGKCKARAYGGEVGAGVELSAKAVEAKLAFIDTSVGVGVSTGVGLKDDSANVKIAGCGVTVGRKLGISFADTYIGIDFGRLF